MKSFPLGQIVATSGALRVFREVHLAPYDFLNRHARGDWGDIDKHDKHANDTALVSGNRLLSAYQLPEGNRLYIITEADRSSTTLLLPEEY